MVCGGIFTGEELTRGNSPQDYFLAKGFFTGDFFQGNHPKGGGDFLEEASWGGLTVHVEGFCRESSGEELSTKGAGRDLPVKKLSSGKESSERVGLEPITQGPSLFLKLLQGDLCPFFIRL